MMLRLQIIILIWLQPFAGWAVQPDEILANPVLEQRARIISSDLRCLVCQNQSIDDSDAELAHDLRIIVRQRLLAGDSDNDAKQYIVSRYGDYVLLRPPFKPATYILWLAPAILFLAGIVIAIGWVRKRNLVELSQPLDTEEQKRLLTLININEKQI